MDSALLEVFHIPDTIGDDLDIHESVNAIKHSLQNGCSHIVLSFESSAYPCSKLLALLVACYRTVHDSHATLSVLSPNQEFSQLICETKLDNILPVYFSLDEIPA